MSFLGNIQISWIDDTSAFVSLSQPEQVQIGKCFWIYFNLKTWLQLAPVKCSEPTGSGTPMAKLLTHSGAVGGTKLLQYQHMCCSKANKPRLDLAESFVSFHDPLSSITRPTGSSSFFTWCSIRGCFLLICTKQTFVVSAFRCSLDWYTFSLVYIYK